MYTIYADGKLLYAPHLSREGCGVFSPKLTVELNKAGSCEFVVPPNNVLYDELSKLKTVITVFQNEDELFRGRILNDEKDFYKQKRTYCEGELAFLLDSKQRPYKFSGNVKDLFKQYIANHNSRVDAAKRFTVGNVTVEYEYESVYTENDNYSTTLDEVNEKLLDTVGGYFKTRGSGDTRYIDWLAESGDENTQTIEFGVNLLDISEYIAADNIFTVLIPIGATVYDEEGNANGKLSISGVNGGKDYIENETAISLFGRIEETAEWSDVEDANELKSLGQETLGLNIELSVTLTVKAVDMHILNVDTERIKLGDWVRVISLPHGLDRLFQCTKIIYDLVSPEQNEYTFGLSFTSLTEKQVVGEKNINSAMSSVNNWLGITDDRMNNAESRLDGAATLDSYGKLTPQQSSSRIVRKNASFSLSNGEAGCFVLCNCTESNGDITMTIPNDTSIPVGTEVEVIRWDGGSNLTITNGANVVLCSVKSKALVYGARNISSPYGVATLKKIDLNTWLLVGQLS